MESFLFRRCYPRCLCLVPSVFLPSFFFFSPFHECPVAHSVLNQSQLPPVALSIAPSSRIRLPASFRADPGFACCQRPRARSPNFLPIFLSTPRPFFSTFPAGSRRLWVASKFYLLVAGNALLSFHPFFVWSRPAPFSFFNANRPLPPTSPEAFTER